jgi:hypothetical protein
LAAQDQAYVIGSAIKKNNKIIGQKPLHDLDPNFFEPVDSTQNTPRMDAETLHLLQEDILRQTDRHITIDSSDDEEEIQPKIQNLTLSLPLKHVHTSTNWT